MVRKNNMIKLTALVLFGALFLPAAVPAQEPPEDPFDRRIFEKTMILKEATERRDAARKKWRETRAPEDWDQYREANKGLRQTSRKAMPSKLDMWEARERLREYIRDSDDGKVFELYLLVRSRDAREKRELAELEKAGAKLKQQLQDLEQRGVDLTAATPPER